MTDEEIDYSDIPPLDDDFFARATLRRPQQPRLGYVPEGQGMSVAIASDLLAQVVARAQEHGVSGETLVNLWIQEKVAAG